MLRYLEVSWAEHRYMCEVIDSIANDRTLLLAGVVGAQNGTLSFMVGGPEEA